MFLFGLPRNEKKRLLVFGYPKRNDFSSLSFNFGNGNGNGNKMLFPLSLPGGELAENAREQTPVSLWLNSIMSMLARLSIFQMCMLALYPLFLPAL